jgi:glycosyltransferase involved in cell wall biosynthesis
MPRLGLVGHGRRSCLKVLVVNPSLFAPFYDYEFCRALAEIGISVTMVGRPARRYEVRPNGSFTLAPLFYRRPGEREAGWQTSRLGHIRKGIQHAFGLRALEKLAFAQRADIVHFQWLVLPLLDRIALRRLRRRCGLVLTVHNAEIATHSPGAVVGKIGAALQSLGQKGAVLGFDRYVVHTARTRAHLIELGIPSERIVYKHHPPLHLATPTPLPADPEEDGRRSILFFGQIKPYKGVDVLIEAGIAMASVRRDFRITIAGRPFQSLEALRARIARAGVEDVFSFDLDYLPEERLAKYLARASIVVFPYREIDGSGALSHAVRFGKPIVATSVGGFAEYPFKDHIELVPRDDAKALATALTLLLDDPVRLEELGRQASTLWSLLPSWVEFAQACHSAYREIAPKHV